MPDIAVLRVKLLADLAEVDQMREKVTHSMRQINSETKTQMREASGSIELIGEQMGIVLPRHLRTFIAKLPGVGEAMSAAFNAVAVFALIGIVVEAGKKIQDFIKKNSEAAEKLRESQEAFGLTVQKVYNSYAAKLLEAGIKADELRHDHLGALHKQLELIDQQGFDQLAGAFDKLSQAAQKTFDGLKSDWLDTVRTFLTTGSVAAGSSGVAASATKYNTEYQSLLAQGKGGAAQSLLNDTQQREEHIYALMDQVIRHRANPSSTAPYAAIDELRKTYGINSGNTFDFQKQHDAQQTFVRSLEAQQNIAASQRQLTTTDKHSATVESAKSALSDHMQQLEEQLSSRETDHEHLTGNKLPAGQVMAYWQQHLADFAMRTKDGGLAAQQPKEYTDALQKLNAAVQEAHQQFAAIVKQAKTDWQTDIKFATQNQFGMLGGKSAITTSDATDTAHENLVRESNLQQVKLNEELTASATRYAVVTGAISQHDAAMQMAAAHQQAFTAELDVLNAHLSDLQKEVTLTADDAQKNADEQLKVRGQIVQLSAQTQQQQREDALATESAMDRMFDHIRSGAQNLDEKIAAIMEHTLDGINDQMVGAMFGDTTNFSKLFKQSSRSMAKAFLEWGEGSLMGKKNQAPQDKFKGSVDKFSAAVDRITTGSGGTGAAPSGAGASPSGGGILSSIPGVAGITDSIKNSSIGQWIKQNGGKYMPGAMSGIGGLMSMFSGPQHTRGAGSGVANALSDAGYKQNGLSRFLSGFGQIAQGAGSMMFAGAGGMGGLDKAMMNSNMSSGMSSFFSNFVGGLPGFASGGSVYGGVPIEVGEHGPEVWTPPSGGHITPNRDLSHMGNGGVTIGNIYGADPAITRQSVAQAIAASQSHAVVNAQAKMIDRQRRTPR
jgi:hypothetical protein